MRGMILILCAVALTAARGEDVTSRRAVEKSASRAAVKEIKASGDYQTMTNQLAQYDGHWADATNQAAQYTKHAGQLTGLTAAANVAIAGCSGSNKVALAAIQTELDKIVAMLGDLSAGADKGLKAGDDVHDATVKMKKVLLDVVEMGGK